MNPSLGAAKKEKEIREREKTAMQEDARRREREKNETGEEEIAILKRTRDR